MRLQWYWYAHTEKGNFIVNWHVDFKHVWIGADVSVRLSMITASLNLYPFGVHIQIITPAYERPSVSEEDALKK